MYSASLFMLTLFICELWAFLSVAVTTSVVLDPNTDPLVRINFNITVYDVPCEFAMIDVVDVLGTRNDNVTKNINKWNVNRFGERQSYDGRNKKQKDYNHDNHHDLNELHENGISAKSVTEREFPEHIRTHDHTFVNFYAPWCIWCQRLEPVWEAFAEEAELAEDTSSISIIKVDCVANRMLCMEQRVQAFPTLRWFNGQQVALPDYRSDRTVAALMEYLRNKVAHENHILSLPHHQQQAHREMTKEDHHPGCQMAGFLLVNRVPGNFHIEARSNFHNLNPVMANLSHAVHQLSFGQIMSKKVKSMTRDIPDEYFSEELMSPMDNGVFMNHDLHTAYHHYLKVVSTHFGSGFSYGSNSLISYQMVESSQIMKYDAEDIPEARFSYDLSPMAVVISKKSKKWYEFITSMCALIGGTFTVVGLVSSFLNVVLKAGKKI